MKTALLACATLVLSAGLARAEGPVAPPGGENPVDAIRKAAIRISRALKENEEALTKIARGEAGTPAPVDVDLPKSGGTPDESASGAGT